MFEKILWRPITFWRHSYIFGWTNDEYLNKVLYFLKIFFAFFSPLWNFFQSFQIWLRSLSVIWTLSWKEFWQPTAKIIPEGDIKEKRKKYKHCHCEDSLADCWCLKQGPRLESWFCKSSRCNRISGALRRRPFLFGASIRFFFFFCFSFQSGEFPRARWDYNPAMICFIITQCPPRWMHLARRKTAGMREQIPCDAEDFRSPP